MGNGNMLATDEHVFRIFALHPDKVPHQENANRTHDASDNRFTHPV